MVDPLQIWDTLVACLTDESAGLSPPLAKVTHRTGTGAADALIGIDGNNECCNLGIVRHTGIVPTDNPELSQSDDTTSCGPFGWAVSFDLAIYRCPPTSNMHIPTINDWADAAKTQIDDATAINRAIVCCFDDQFPDTDWIIGQTEPLVIESACTGISVSVTVALAADEWPGCCPDSP